jgi:hypothetical protein
MANRESNGLEAEAAEAQVQVAHGRRRIQWVAFTIFAILNIIYFLKREFG